MGILMFYVLICWLLLLIVMIFVMHSRTNNRLLCYFLFSENDKHLLKVGSKPTEFLDPELIWLGFDLFVYKIYGLGKINPRFKHLL